MEIVNGVMTAFGYMMMLGLMFFMLWIGFCNLRDKSRERRKAKVNYANDIGELREMIANINFRISEAEDRIKDLAYQGGTNG